MTQQYWRRRFCTLPSAPPLVWIYLTYTLIQTPIQNWVHISKIDRLLTSKSFMSIHHLSIRQKTIHHVHGFWRRYIHSAFMPSRCLVVLWLCTDLIVLYTRLTSVLFQPFPKKPKPVILACLVDLKDQVHPVGPVGLTKGWMFTIWLITWNN